jgi:undecaprenyl-diphosphatase
MTIVTAAASYPDDGIYRWMVSLARHTGWLHGAADFWTSAGVVLPVLLALVGLWLGRRRGLDMLLRSAWVPGAMVVAFAVSLVVKNIFAEHRPCQEILVHTVDKCPGPTDYSFPSNHSVLAMAGAVALFGMAGLGKRLGLIGVVSALVVAVTRVYLGDHYPHDALAGLIVGGTVAALGLWAGRALLPVVVPVLESRLPGVRGRHSQQRDGARDSIPG